MHATSTDLTHRSTGPTGQMIVPSRRAARTMPGRALSNLMTAKCTEESRTNTAARDATQKPFENDLVIIIMRDVTHENR